MFIKVLKEILKILFKFFKIIVSAPYATYMGQFNTDLDDFSDNSEK
ncbi:hypothetical protein IJ596_08150 [bacterium]|nr:hypothetical protein [bacterium]